MTRTEKAASIRHNGVPVPFIHNPASKPSGAPDISALTSDEKAAINNWLKVVDNDFDNIAQPPTTTLDGGTALSGTALSKISDYQTWLAGSAYIAWKSQNVIFRDAQYRLALVDALETLDANGTVPISLDPSGTGSNPPASISQPAASISKCTSSGDWTASSSGTTPTSSARTITVPAGNSGSLKFTFTKVPTNDTLQYSKNGGSYITLTNNQVVVFANTDTITLKATVTVSGGYVSGTVYDNDTGQVVGDIDLERT